MDIITGYLGEPHVTAEQDRDVNIGVVGDGSYVMPTGQRLAAEVQTKKEVRIRDGVLIHQGCAASIKKNTYDTVTITNGSQGMKRIDLIVARYQRNVETGVESLGLVALQGTPVESDPAVPVHTEGDIQAGDAVADMPLYEVEKDGLNITRVTKVFEEVENLSSLNGKMALSYGTGALLQVQASPDNLIYGAYNPGIYYFDGSAQGVPVSRYNGVMLTFRESGTSNMIKLALSTDGSIHRMVQRSNGEVAQNWKSVW